MKALVHRYDNEPDILAVEGNECSEVYTRSRDDDFDYVVVVPTKSARTDIAIVADAVSGQYQPDKPKPWPGRPDMYPVRVDVANVRYTTVDAVRRAFEEAGVGWAGQWSVRNVTLGDELLGGAAGTAGGVNSPTEDEEEEPSAVEGIRTETVTYSKGRNRRLRELALVKADGVCCVCGTDYKKVLAGKGVRVLQVHHRQQLAATDSPVVTRLSDLAVVCANCHMLIHMNPRQAFGVEELKKMLLES